MVGASLVLLSVSWVVAVGWFEMLMDDGRFLVGAETAWFGLFGFSFTAEREHEDVTPHVTCTTWGMGGWA